MKDYTVQFEQPVPNTRIEQRGVILSLYMQDLVGF
jgi:hypothetical protein